MNKITLNSKFARTPLLMDKHKILVEEKDDNGNGTGKYTLKNKSSIFTQIEFKLFLNIISYFHPSTPTEDLVYTFNREEFLERLNIGKNLSSNDINKVLESINKYTVKFSAVSEDCDGSISLSDVNLSIFPTAICSKTTGKITIRINPDFANFFWNGNILRKKTKLIELRENESLKDNKKKEHYFTIDKENIDKLKSAYAIRLYLYFKSLESYGKTEIKLENLKELLGVSESKSEYKIFKRNILNKAIKDINENTDISIETTEVKISRAVVKLQFDITTNSNDIEPKTEEYCEELESEIDESINEEKEINKKIELSVGENKVVDTWTKYLGDMDIEDKKILLSLLDKHYPYQIGSAIVELWKEKTLSKEFLISELNKGRFESRTSNKYSKKKNTKSKNSSNTEDRRVIGFKECNVSGAESKKRIEAQLGTNDIVDFDAIFRRK